MALVLNPAVADDYESKTLAQMRGLVFDSCGFQDPLTFGPPRSMAQLRQACMDAMGFIGAYEPIQTPGPGGTTYPPTRTLKNLRDSINNRLGLALALIANLDTYDNIKTDVYVAMGYSSQATSPPGVDALLQTWIEQAQSTLLARIEFDRGPLARPPAFTTGQTSTVDATPIRLLAIAYGKAHDGSQDAGTWKNEAEKYLADIVQRTPPNIVGLINSTIIGAHRSVIRRYEVGNVGDPLSPNYTDFGVRITGTGDYRATTDDANECETDDNAVELLALAMLKEKIGHPDAKAAMDQFNQYMVDLDKRTPPSPNTITSALTSANETIFRRYPVGNFGPTAQSQNWLLATGPTFKFDDDLPQVDDQAVYLLALANLQQQFKMDGWKQTRADYETYMDDLFRRRPPNAVPLVNSILKAVQQQLFRQYSLFRCKYWFTWAINAGQRFYGSFDHDGAQSQAPINLKAVAGAAVTANQPVPRQDHAAYLLPDGFVHVFGGKSVGGSYVAPAQHWNAGWFTDANMTTARSEFGSCVLSDGRVFIIGGYNGAALQTHEVYTPGADTWAAPVVMPAARRGCVATRIQGGYGENVLVTGGTATSGSAGFTQALIWIPSSPGSYVNPASQMAKQRVAHSATALNDGRVLVCGGQLYTPAVVSSNTTEIFTPNWLNISASTFANGPNMNAARRYHSATLLLNGKVLIAGGWDAAGLTLKTAELFDPVTNTFTLIAAPMNQSRSLHAATLMNDGRVLLAGDASAANGATAEVYDPATNTFTSVANTMSLAVAEMPGVLMTDGTVMIVGGATPTSVTGECNVYDPLDNVFNELGNLVAGDTFWRVTATTNNGESDPGNEAFLLNNEDFFGANLSWTIRPGQPYVTGFKIYRGKVSGTERYIASVGPTVNTFTDTGQLPATYSLPSENNTQGPGALDVRKIEWIGISQDNVSWRPLVVGIPATTYNNNQQGIPEFCEIRQAIELWPTPAMTGWKLRIKGSFAPFVFESDNDRTTLDWQAIWFYAVAAAKVTFKRLDGRPLFGQADIATAGAMADEYLGNLVAGQHMGQRYIPGEPVRRNEVQPILLPRAKLVREINLNTSSAGMTRLRVKGGASPESLYELYNGFINASKIPQQRPCASYRFNVPPASKGLVLYKGAFYTFSALPVTAVPGSTNLVLRHPNWNFAGTIKQIHFAQPFMGYLYVVAEFNVDGTIPATIVHYWLQMPAAWVGNSFYKVGDLVQPIVPNGYYYRAAQPADFAPAWTPRLGHKLNDKVQPTVYNGFYYVAIAINGDYVITTQTAVSGLVEPIWPTDVNQTVEESSTGAVTVTPSDPPEPPAPLPPGMRDGQGDASRYTNLGGSGGRLPWANTPIRVR